MNVSIENRNKKVKFYKILEMISTKSRIILQKDGKQLFNGNASEANKSLVEYFRDPVYSITARDNTLFIELDDV